MLDTAVYVAYYGEDPHLSGNPEDIPISRGVPLSKAMDESTLLAWEMNGEPLPPHHGFPIRVVAPGFPASASGKWLRRLWVRDQVHDGPKMTGFSYRVPRYPVPPGTEVPEEDMEIIGPMPLKSIITRPETGGAPFRGKSAGAARVGVGGRRPGDRDAPECRLRGHLAGVPT